MKKPVLAGSLLFVIQLATTCIEASDWPMWRYDAERSATTPHELPGSLELAWRRDLPTPRPAWSEDPRLLFDATYEPVVVGKTMFVASGQTDSLAAYDTANGKLRWQFFADGPIRFAPVVVEGCVMFGADDGWFYCLDAGSGSLRWKYDAAPGVRKALGNGRLVSVWPVRGGAVISEGKVHFTAGVWPFEGSYLYSFDVTAAVASGSAPPKPKVTFLLERCPQGYLVSNGPQVFIPAGRDAAIRMHHESGSNLPLQYQTPGLSDFHVTLSGKWLLHGHQVISYADGAVTRFEIRRPVTAGNEMYGVSDGNIVAHDLNDSKIVDALDPRGNPYKKREFARLWQLPQKQLTSVLADAGHSVDPEALLEINLRAGRRLYGHWGSVLFAIDIPDKGGEAKVGWTDRVDGDAASMVAADDRLFVCTRQGSIHCFADVPSEPQVWSTRARQLAATPASTEVANLLAASGTSEGFSLVWGLESDQWAAELLRQSRLHVIALDPDGERVARMRHAYSQGTDCLYGDRLSIIQADPAKYSTPPYLANLIVVPNPTSYSLQHDVGAAAHLFRSLRPYGGTCVLKFSDSEHAEFVRLVAAAAFSKANVQRSGEFTLLIRAGALEGAANWTHEFGDPANSLMSRDRLVKPPLGVLWYGGAAAQNELYFDRHSWGPSAAVVDGRMYLQGPERFGAVDIYTGRLFWMIPLDRGSSPGRRGNYYDGDDNTGYHFLALSDAVYLAHNDTCWHLDPTSGKKLGEYKLPGDNDYWGSIRAAGDLLIVQVFDSLKKSARPVKLVALNRNTGDLVWQREAEQEFPLVAVGKESLFCLDGKLPGLFNAWTRAGVTPKSDAEQRIRAIDLQTGKDRWNLVMQRPPTWLSYSDQHDVLLASSREGLDAFLGVSGSKLWNKSIKAEGFQGHPENRWDAVILWNDWVIDQRGPASAYHILSGKQIMHTNPVSGEEVPWKYTQSGHHCAYAIACENLLTFRASTGGFVDLQTLGSSRLQGFRPGCRNSLIPAGGILNSPNFGHGCVCSYSLFTSLALIHVPEVEIWTYGTFEKPTAGGVKQIGINLGAPGDRLAANGTLWLDYPSVGGSSPDIEIDMDVSQVRWYRLHAGQIRGDGLAWVGSSGAEGLRGLSIKLPAPAAEGAGVRYQVRLYFAEPDDVQSGDRVFDIAIDGNTVLKGMDVVQQADGPRRVIVKEFETTLNGSPLRIDFSPQTGKPILAGVELLRK